MYVNKILSLPEIFIGKVIDLQEFKIENTYQVIEMSLYSAVSLFLPMILGHPQYLVGAIVNAMLVLSALNLKSHKILPAILLPSVGVFLAGVLFGSLTKFVIYFIPFIWVGNAILVFGIKWLYLYKKKNYLLTLAISSLFKAGFLFSAAFVLFKLGIVPVMFLTTMGVLQLQTALMGGAGAFAINKIRRIAA